VKAGLLQISPVASSGQSASTEQTVPVFTEQVPVTAYAGLCTAEEMKRKKIIKIVKKAGL
jgi:hypothetical protein